MVDVESTAATTTQRRTSSSSLSFDIISRYGPYSVPMILRLLLSGTIYAVACPTGIIILLSVG